VENIKNAFHKNIKQYSMLIALIVIMVMFQILTGGILLKPINVSRLIFQNSYILILAIGMLLTILTGGNIDLAVGSMVAFVSALSAVFSVTWGLPVWVSIIMALLAGLLAGMWQGFWIAYVKIPPFIVTLAGMLLFRGINNIILNGQTVLLPEMYINISSGVIPDILGGRGIHLTTLVVGVVFALIYATSTWLIRISKQKNDFVVESMSVYLIKTMGLSAVIVLFAYWLALANGLPYILIILGVLIGIYSFITQKTVIGRHIYAMGGNTKAAALSGIKTKQILFGVYANMGLMAAVAGIIFAGRLNSASPTAGEGFELDAIAACFIGGASATGGVGTIMGAVIGGFIMGILNNGMSIMGIGTFWQQVVKGLVLLSAVAFDVYSKSKVKTAK
jgi:putative multiple sugar transport system permease protein